MTGREYLDLHPFCEISSCGAEATERHHIRARGRKGRAQNDDSPANSIALCRVHHVEAHTMGRRRFPAKYGLMERWEAAWN
jgi:hypothetical protein